MRKLWQLKLKAFSLHILFSVVIIALFMGLVTQFWYPDILFSVENVWEGLQILIPVDAILGPVLTLILFVPGKKGLMGDLIIVAILQILALVYGGYAIYQQRPEIIVFAGDRFEIIPSSIFDRENFATTHFNENRQPYPFIVYALPAQTKEEKNNFILNNIQYQKMSERYRPLSNYKDIIKTKALKLSSFLPESEASLQNIKAFKKRFNTDDTLLFVLEGSTGISKLLVLDRQNLQYLGYLDLNPWTEYKSGN